jgi:hypothetical protein
MYRAAIACALVVSVACAGAAVAQTAPQQAQKFPDVLAVEVRAAGANRFDFDVTVSSPYDSARRYADGIRARSKDGVVYGKRKLFHDHAEEQPFTRDMYRVEVPAGVRSVVVEARDQRFGYRGKTVEVDLPGR